MKKKFLPLVTLLFLYLGMAGTLDAQEPVFAEPIDNAFGLEYAAEPGQRVWVRLVDIDGDGILEAFVLKGNPDTPCCGDVEYYENEGTTENPHFVFSQNYPFGMPQEETIWAYQFVDIDGDGDFDLSYFQFDLDAPVRILRNKGTASAPDFSGNFEENPFGISLPESELEPGNLLDVVTPVFADYDQDGDVDLMLNGLFLNAEEDEGYYFSENIGTPTQPQFDAPEKNPFELDYPGGSYHQSAFVDLDCDGDQDLYTIVVNSPFPEVNLRFYENTKTLQGEPQFDEEPLLWYPINTVDYRFLPASGTFLDKDGDGDLDFICGEFGIHFWENLSAPEVDFSHVQVGGKFAFTDSSSLIVGDPTAWHWDFGDGNTSDVQNPTHTYLEDGTYEVCLTVWGNLNCHNTVCKTIITKVFPWHTFPVLNPFGLEDYTAPDTLSEVSLVDIDNDGIQEAFILLFDFKNHFDPASCPPHKWWCWWDFKYYENNGTDAAPDFQYQESFPFGIPYDSLYWPSQFIDLDGDGDKDLVFQRYDFAIPLVYLENTGTPEDPWFGDSEFQYNPFGIIIPVSDTIPGKPYDDLQPSFVDIDADGDYDLFLGGHFADFDPANNPFDENYYFYLNEGDCENPQFAPPLKNPFNLGRPPLFNHLLSAYRFVDMDCDGDWDMFTLYAGKGMSFHENIGSAEAPDFGSNPLVWKVEDGPPPPGFLFFAYGQNNWIDVGGDEDWDQIFGGFAGITFWENISNGTMACQGPIPPCGQTSVVETRSNIRLALYPNPSGDLLIFDFQSMELLGEIAIEIFDVFGHRVKSLSKRVSSTSLREQISLAGLPEGVYTLGVGSNEKYITRKFVKMN